MCKIPSTVLTSKDYGNRNMLVSSWLVLAEAAGGLARTLRFTLRFLSQGGPDVHNPSQTTKA